MTAQHISLMHFNGSGEAAKKRLYKLKAEGLVGERERHVNQPSLLFLTTKAFEVLRQKEKLTDYPRISHPALTKRTSVSDLTLHHELEVMDPEYYLNATNGTPFDPTQRSNTKSYRRQAEREHFIDHTIRKSSLLAISQE